MCSADYKTVPYFRKLYTKLFSCAMKAGQLKKEKVRSYTDRTCLATELCNNLTSFI